jgi:AmmeMemoRadiSam system protein A
VSDALASGGLTLLRAARDAIEAAVIGRGEQRSHEEDAPALRRLGASFVTLRTRAGELRGCIGELEARRPLVESVRSCAIGAALRDPRFAPVRADELDALAIAISVLTPASVVRGPSDIEIGRHGILVERGLQRGVLLPEVATDQGWDAETFLGCTCRKAGLGADAWRDAATTIRVFETVKLAE